MDPARCLGQSATMAPGETEILEFADFLRRTEPFPAFPPDQLALASSRIEVMYFRRGSRVTRAGDANAYLSIIRSGAVELHLGGTELGARLGEGDCFGYPSLIRRGPAQNEAIAVEDCLLYRIGAETFHKLYDANEGFRRFFDIDESARLRRAVSRMREDSSAGTGQGGDFGMHAPFSALLGQRAVVSCAPGLSIGEAAALMAREDVSTLPICDERDLVGILTDKDLRRRVLAPGLDLSVPVRDVMTPDPVTCALHEPVLTALLTMTRLHIHHLPVVDPAGELAGIVSSSDIMAQMGSNTFHLARQIDTAVDARGVADAAQHLPRALTGLVEAGVDADHVARYVSTIGEIAHRRLLALGEAELGPPPVPYGLVTFGSLARAEQALGSDQDNGFVLGEGFVREQHDDYFARLAQILCDGLDAAGYRYCPGNIMATNPDYRRKAAEWSAHFRGWIDNPDPQAILESGIFFDMRAVAGDAALVDTMRADVFAAAQGNRIFLSFVARAAAATAVPLGFFRNFLLKDDAVEGRVLDLKAQAITPLVDIARTRALAGGIEAVNTADRFAAAAEAGLIEADSARDLAACFEFIRDVRFRHQSAQVKRGEAPTNKLDPGELSRFDREHLRDAFKLIRQQLDKLRNDYAGGLT